MNILNKIKILMFGGILLFASACSEGFLNEEPTDSITYDRMGKIIELNPALSKGVINGMYSLTFKHGVGGYGDHSDFGQKSFDISTDIMCGDMAQLSHKYGQFSDVSDLSATKRTGSMSYKVWRYYYKIIKEANGLIATFDDKMPGSDELKANFGQAKAMRGYSYLNLVNYFQNPYLDNKDAKAVVLALVNDDVPRGLSTVAEVYDIIISDLETAVEALDGFKRANKAAVNQNVVRGLLAYAYLFKGEYAKAEAIANEVIVSEEFRLMSKDEVVNSGFNNVSIPGWMWAIDLTTSNTPALPTFWGMIDIYTYSYAGPTGWAINKGLEDSIPDTDIRKKQFSTDADYPGYPTGKFYNRTKPKKDVKDWTSDEVYMRVAEMYLIKAEAQARQNNDAAAKETLKVFLKERDTNADSKLSSLSGQSLLDEIYFEWRIEMWGEGKAFWAMKRFKKTNTRGTNSFMYPGQGFTYNDDRLILEVPEVELNSNPEISK